MAINIFEGARRILYVVVAAIALVGIYLVVDQVGTLTPSLHYTLDQVGAPPTRVKSIECDYPNYSDWRFLDESPRDVRVYICFKAQKAGEDGWLIPFADKDGAMWFARRDHDGVRGYSNKVLKGFVPPRDHVDEVQGFHWSVHGNYWRELFKYAGTVGGWTVGIIVGLFVLATLVGWIVRGFAGIPMGKDSRVAQSRRSPPAGPDQP